MSDKKPKRAQGNLDSFFSKKSKNEFKSINHNSEISNTAALSEATEPISSALDSPSTSNISPQKDLSKPINSKYDIGLYVNYVGSLPNEEKVSILNNVWTPDPNFIFPTQSYAKFKRQFQIKWLNTFKWLAYSKCKEGAFCKYCVLFLNQNQVGKGSHESLGGLVTKPYTNLKKALETFRCHASFSYHRTAVLNADNIIAILSNKQDNVLVQLNNQLKEDILQNRNMLKPIIQTIRLCGRQQFGLRGHQDSGRISMKEPIQNDGNFRCLLRHRAQHGNNTLKKYLETCSSNAMYTSPLIQNEIINIFGELIQSDIIKKISKSNYFSVLADETTDIAQIEQFSICIRYFEEELVILREDFLTFVPVHDVTGHGLATVLLNTLKELGLDLDKLRGQGYDGAATMSGNFRGVQAIVKNSYPKALYTHCVSHSLNLCLSDAAKTQAIRNSFSIISDCCAFFHSSAKRTTI
ncbi:zinc finger MYM-type protein 1-like [Acyrthosiphon pisum]|uniref:TTF-type domain-containing protein n=1 Tax=Acyrthosiphon pisum TaxID=7029 RepID=A0A8R2JKW9_ACYPI|nr:zinc finger MYM-type protein 1-like [Acyrthosiphon pisum]